MSTKDIVKEVIRIASTAGLSKDIIDLLEKKMALLTEENANLAGKVSKLEVENGQLRAQLKHPSPIVELDDSSRKALRYFCDRNDMVAVQELAQHLACQLARARFVCDNLSSKELIFAGGISNADPRWEALGDNSAYEITPNGRRLCFEQAG